MPSKADKTEEQSFAEDLFNKLDTNKDGSIDINDLKKYYQNFSDGHAQVNNNKQLDKHKPACGTVV